MTTEGPAIDGYWEMGNPMMEITPAAITMIARTQAKIGRPMKN